MLDLSVNNELYLTFYICSISSRESGQEKVSVCSCKAIWPVVSVSPIAEKIIESSKNIIFKNMEWIKESYS